MLKMNRIGVQGKNKDRETYFFIFISYYYLIFLKNIDKTYLSPI